MTAINELRERLDELGIEWDVSRQAKYTNYSVIYESNGMKWAVLEHPYSEMFSISSFDYEVSLEQIIVATIGAGTCKNVCNSISEFTCSACGFNCDLMSWVSLFDGDNGRHRHHHHGTPSYCPNCGRRVVE